MTPEQFEAVLGRRIERVRATLATKRREYSRGDALHNFKRAAEFQRITPEQACWNFAMKHLVSLQDMVEDRQVHPREAWDEKLGDAINYLILLEAITFEGEE